MLGQCACEQLRVRIEKRKKAEVSAGRSCHYDIFALPACYLNIDKRYVSVQ